jgi:glycosyltransferase involved in cell wall biosynthesis
MKPQGQLMVGANWENGPALGLSHSSFSQPNYICESARLEHGPFLSWLIDAQRPRRYVELGCGAGYSYFVACQAVDRLGIQTDCIGIDTWSGDEGTFASVDAYNANNYAAFSRLVRTMTFRDAAALFSDGSIDLLLMSGGHSHEDVSGILNAWRPKLGADAVVLLHGTSVRDRGLGAWKLLESLRQDHPVHEFVHGNGLAVVAVGDIPPRLALLFENSPQTKNFLHVAYAALGGAITRRLQLSELQREMERRVTARDTEWQARAGMLTDTIARREEDLSRQRAIYARAQAQLWAQNTRIQRLIKAQTKVKDALETAESKVLMLKEERTRMETSLSWEITAPLRRSLSRRPRVTHLTISVLRLGWLAVTFQFRQLVMTMGAWVRLRRDTKLLMTDAIFDSAYYRQLSPEIAASALPPVRHYLAYGRFQHLSPHPLFDTQWYRREYPDIGDVDPVLHYARHGRAEGRKPNLVFDPAWYLEQYPEVARSGLDPLQHFMKIGSDLGYDPSPRFKTTWYREHYQDVVGSGLNPLVHFLHYGARENRETNAYLSDFSVAKLITETKIECRKRPSRSGEVALFVAHSPNGRLKAHVRHYLEALVSEGIAVTLIVAADRGFTEDGPWLYDLVDGLYVRENEGWDFACWAHVLRLNRDLYGAEILYWLNDSLIGPVNQPAFHAMLERVRRQQTGLVGLTDNYERGYHIQSFFLAFKREALESLAFHEFLLSVKSFDDKDDVINSYEIRLAPKLKSGGVSISTIFASRGQQNPVVFYWREMLEDGFPFLKILAITNDIKYLDKDDWREVLHKHGYDVLLADQMLAEREDVPAPQQRTESACPVAPRNDPLHVAFIGPSNYDNGLGVAARGYLSALMHTDFALNAYPITRPFHIHRRVSPGLASTEFVDDPDVAIVHLNPESWRPLMNAAQARMVEAARHRIGAFVWEAQTLPARFMEGRLKGLSAIWVPSRFCLTAFERFGGAPVQVIPYAVPVRADEGDRARVTQLKREIGLEEEHRIILYSFDASSYLARKNPLALVRAFNASGLAGKGWRLVLKTKHLSEVGAHGAALIDAVKRSAGTLIVDRSMAVDGVNAFMDAADIYASPHAAEGFGLTVAEAMARGKPVIATDYGGTTDFLDTSCGFPIQSTPWVLDDDEGVYPKGTVWAKVDEDRLAAALGTVGDLSPAERAEIGSKARQRIGARLSPAAVARRIRDSIASLSSDSPGIARN